MHGALTRSRGAVLSAFAAALAFGCVVQDVALVDHFSNAGSGGVGNVGGAGSPGSAGNSSSNEGGEDAAAGDGSSGGTPNAGSSAGGQAGTSNPGGTGGTNPGGSAGMNQGGSGNPDPILDVQSCPDPTYILCDNFEAGANGLWSTDPTPKVIADAPSGEHVLAMNFTPERVQYAFAEVKISFWVRLQTVADQPVVSIFSNNQDKVQLGLEESRLRWTYWSGVTQSTGNVRVPPVTNASPLLPINSWFCVELAIVANPKSLNARVVIPGSAPFVMPTVDGEPTAGIDDQWNMTYNWGVNTNAGFIFGVDGAYQEFDDVMIGSPNQKTLCELYEEVNDP